MNISASFLVPSAKSNDVILSSSQCIFSTVELMYVNPSAPLRFLIKNSTYLPQSSCSEYAESSSISTLFLTKEGKKYNDDG